jgi:predicted ester cyclase
LESEVDGYQPTGLPVIERASAVYKIEDEKVSEYWIQIDR